MTSDKDNGKKDELATMIKRSTSQVCPKERKGKVRAFRVWGWEGSFGVFRLKGEKYCTIVGRNADTALCK